MILILHQIQKEYLVAANKPLYNAFVDQEKAFNSVPVGDEQAAGAKGPVYVQGRRSYVYQSICSLQLFP